MNTRHTHQDLRAPLSESFLRSLDEPLRVEFARLEGLEEQLTGIVTVARQTWGDLSVPAEAFMEYVAGQIQPEQAVDDGLLTKMRAGDLYLACACILKVPGAIEVLEENCFSRIGGVLGKLNLPPSLIDETVQRVRNKLLVGEGGELPRLAQYSGRGALSSWINVVAVREGRDILRRNKRWVPVQDQSLMDQITPHEDPELVFLKRRYRDSFAKAFCAGLASLDSNERTLLRYRYIDELNIDDIGRIHGVHRATAARWLEKARGLLLNATRVQLRAMLAVNSDELDSIMRLISSQLHVTLSKLYVSDD